MRWTRHAPTEPGTFYRLAHGAQSVRKLRLEAVIDEDREPSLMAFDEGDGSVEPVSEFRDGWWLAVRAALP